MIDGWRPLEVTEVFAFGNIALEQRNSSKSNFLLRSIRFDSIRFDFRPRPIKFVEKSRAGAQMLCLAFSPGGYFVAAGSSDSVIRVYSFHTYSPLKICELDPKRRNGKKPFA